MLVELSVVEQRYAAVLEVVRDGLTVEVAERYAVSRQTIYSWVHRYETGVAREQEERAVEVVGLTVTRQQGVAQDPVLDLRHVDHRRGDLRLDEARHQAVHPDAVAAPLRRPLPMSSSG